LDLSLDTFRWAFIHSAHLSVDEPLGMVFEHLWDLFDTKDLTNGFSQLFVVYSYVIVGHIFGSVIKAFNVARLLLLVKPFGGIQPIVICEILYRLMNKTLCFQFHYAFLAQCSPTSLGVVVRGSCEIMVHNIWTTLKCSPWLGGVISRNYKCFQHYFS
jgi:hypothetical protein